MMSKKHYVAIAAAVAANASRIGVRQPGHNIDAGYRQATEDLASALATIFASENPNFNRVRFLKACGLEG